MRTDQGTEQPPNHTGLHEYLKCACVLSCSRFIRDVIMCSSVNLRLQCVRKGSRLTKHGMEGPLTVVSWCCQRRVNSTGRTPHEGGSDDAVRWRVSQNVTGSSTLFTGSSALGVSCSGYPALTCSIISPPILSLHSAAVGVGFYGNSETNDGVYQLTYSMYNANHTLGGVDSLVSSSPATHTHTHTPSPLPWGYTHLHLCPGATHTHHHLCPGATNTHTHTQTHTHRFTAEHLL